jgi:uncharacterized membrane protein
MNYLIIVACFCFLIIPVFYKTKKFNRGWGIVLIVLGILALILRFTQISSYPLIALYNLNTILKSFLILLGCLLLFSAFALFASELLLKRRLYFLKLVPVYIFWGAFQQMFFLWIFTDSFFYLTKNLQITFIVSVIYFFLIHLKLNKTSWKLSDTSFFGFLIIFSSINTYIYLYLGNIIPQLLFHGILGTICYVSFNSEDQIAEKWD